MINIDNIFFTLLPLFIVGTAYYPLCLHSVYSYAKNKGIKVLGFEYSSFSHIYADTGLFFKLLKTKLEAREQDINLVKKLVKLRKVALFQVTIALIESALLFSHFSFNL